MSPDSLRGRLYSAMNELAGLFYVTFGRNDSSLYWYRRVLAEDPEGPHNARALFTLAQISSRDSLAQNLPPADSLYRQIIGRFPKSEFAAESRRLLGLPPVVEERDPAGAMYERIEQMILAGRNEAAVDSLSALVSAYPASSFSPRALYARAWLYEEKLGRPDSALAGYEHLMATYPTSPAAVAVRSRITGVIAMQKAEASQAARADSNAQRKDVPIDDDVRARGAGKHPAGEPLPNPPKPDLAPAPARKDGSPVE
jgi:tetratricopeptide (TPR) repeat protein